MARAAPWLQLMLNEALAAPSDASALGAPSPASAQDGAPSHAESPTGEVHAGAHDSAPSHAESPPALPHVALDGAACLEITPAALCESLAGSSGSSGSSAPPVLEITPAAPPHGVVEGGRSTAALAALCATLGRLLGLRGPVLADAPFGAMGGTSMLAVRLAVELHQEAGWEMPPEALLTSPTLRAAARSMRREDARHDDDDEEEEAYGDAERSRQRSQRLARVALDGWGQYVGTEDPHMPNPHMPTSLQRSAGGARGGASGGASGGAMPSSQDGAIPGAQDGAMPGAQDGAMPGAQDGAMSGAQDGAMPSSRKRKSCSNNDSDGGGGSGGGSGDSISSSSDVWQVRAWAEGGRAERGEAAWALAGAGSVFIVGGANKRMALAADSLPLCGKDMAAADPPTLCSAMVASGLRTWTRAEGNAAEVNAPEGIAAGGMTPEGIAQEGMATLRLAWKHELGRCVDAAPLLVCEAWDHPCERWDHPGSSVHSGVVSGGGISGGGEREGVHACGAITETARAVCCYVGSHAGRYAITDDH